MTLKHRREISLEPARFLQLHKWFRNDVKWISGAVLTESRRAKTRRLARAIRRDESLENKQRDLSAARDAEKGNAHTAVFPAARAGGIQVVGVSRVHNIPHPRYLPTADDPPSRVSPRSPRGSSSPSRSAPFARRYRHFRSQYHLPPAASRPPAVDLRSCVSKHRFADQLKARFLARVRARATKEADSDTQMYAASINNECVSKKKRKFWLKLLLYIFHLVTSYYIFHLVKITTEMQSRIFLKKDRKKH